MNRTRIIIAFLLSPFAAAVYLTVLVFLFNNPIPAHVGKLVATIMFFAKIGVATEIILGIPLLLLFRYLHLMKLPWFLLGGFIIGVALFSFFDRSLSRIKWGLMYCVVPAMISAAAFWFLGWWAYNKSLDASGGSAFRNQT